MSKKYLSLDEAATILGIAQQELLRLRERGDIRGFADRGTWKFKQEDVENLIRSRQADSSPEVPLFGGDEYEETVSFDINQDVGEQPTVIRKDSAPADDDNFLLDDAGGSLGDSDSDVRLVGGADLDVGMDSDSDVKLAGLDDVLSGADAEGTLPEFKFDELGSDSDVQLIGPDSGSKLKPGDSDSDVQLISDEDSALPITEGSDDAIAALSGTDADVSLLGDDENAMAIDFDEDTGMAGAGSVLADESGIALGGDSALLIGAESGISLEGPSDSGIALDSDEDEGITLALDHDSGISLDTGDSGISLESVGDSGISLEGDRNSGTIPMMNIMADQEPPETQFEIPSLGGEDSSYQLQDDGDTGVFEIQSQGGGGESDLDDAVFDLDEGQETFEAEEGFESEDLEMEEDAFSAEEELDVFESDEDAFGSEQDDEFAPTGGGRMMMVEQEWGAGTFAGLTIATLFLLVCGAVMIDLVKNTATASQPNPISGMVLDMLGGLYKG